MKGRHAIAIAALLLAVPPVAARSPVLPPAPAVANFSWLAGIWEEVTEKGWTEESWLPPRGGIMIGASRAGTGDKLGLFEHLRIEADKDGKISYVAMPQGRAGVPFALVSAGVREMVFENKANDYPQRIAYRMNGSELVATISLADGSKAHSWRYRRKV